MIKQYDHLFKIVIIGDSGVGKSSILFRFADDNFSDNYLATIGVDFKFKTINIQGQFVKYQIWDTAGQQRFRTITSAYYKGFTYLSGCNGVVLVYDITNKQSFQSIQKFWNSQVQSYAGENVILTLVGNKNDQSQHKKKVYSDLASDYAQRKNMLFYQVSAKTSENINELFENLGKKLIEKKKKQKKSINFQNNYNIQMPLSNQQNIKKKNKCC